MKNIKYTMWISLIVALVISSCRPDEFAEVGEPADRLADLQGTWALTSVIQSDLDAARKGFPQFAQVQDLTNSFPYSQFNLTLNGDGTFSVTAGNSPNIIGGLTSGNWMPDNEQFPSTIMFTQGAGTSNVTIGSFADVANGRISFSLTRFQGENPVVEYEYVLTKQ